MHVWHAATPCPQLHVFQARRHLPCDTRGPCVRAFPGAARSPDASTSGQSGGLPDCGRLHPGSSSFPWEAYARGARFSFSQLALLGRPAGCHPPLCFPGKTPFLCSPASFTPGRKRLLCGFLSSTRATYFTKLCDPGKPLALVGTRLLPVG